MIIGQIKDGIVLDHITAGKSIQIYDILGLGKLDCTVAMIKNADSNKMGKKDIIKISGSIEDIDLDVVGFVSQRISVVIIKDGKVVEKRAIHHPKKLTNVIKCKNPRCITSVENELPNIFLLSETGSKTYRCIYCEEKYTG